MAIRRVVFDPNDADGDRELYPYVDAFDEMAEWEHDFPETKAALEELERLRAEDSKRYWQPEAGAEWEGWPEEQPQTEAATAALLAGKARPWEPDYRPSSQELDRRMRAGRDGQLEELGLVRNEVFSESAGITFIPAPVGRSGTGRKPDWHKATRVYGKDDPENFRYERIGNDDEAIREWLTRDGRTLEAYAPALRRGKPSADAEAIRGELDTKLGELIEMGANRAAIARVLGISADSITRRLRAA
jgi:hypothetical protein